MYQKRHNITLASTSTIQFMWHFYHFSAVYILLKTNIADIFQDPSIEIKNDFRNSFSPWCLEELRPSGCRLYGNQKLFVKLSLIGLR